ncbi:family 43 glycosylhydrolase [Paenibacillus sp. GYB003]|uniref:family 43 glycosylhydrolase n=1 Tax=Paenibacillus sp. GYB003 TaxID=2994392 RepID=UPI002F96D490
MHRTANADIAEAPVVLALKGNYADPSIIRVGADYYMTHTSYKHVPGLIVWHSRDLLRWTPISAALHEYVGDVWAPELVCHEGKFYIYFPAARTNWVVTADSPHGPWSRPVDLKLKGIDPGHVAGPDGNRYLYVSGIDIVPLSDDGMSVVGPPRRVYEGWHYPAEWEVEAFGLEGPKATYRNGYYYMTAAEGGTAGPPTSHMVVSSRSRTPWGPWEHSPYNPIVRTASASERWWSRGHGTLADTPHGDWYIAYHGYLNGFHTLGRQTLLQKVEWTADGWYNIASGTGAERTELAKAAAQGAEPQAGGHVAGDDWEDDRLGLHWQWYGEPRRERFRPGGGELRVDGAPGESPPAPLLYMAGDCAYEAEVDVIVRGGAEGRLMLYYNEQAYLGIGVSAGGVRHFRSHKSYASIPCRGDRVRVRIRNDRHIVSFHYSEDGVHWRKYDKTADASGFHHNTFGGFLSLRVGLDAAGEGTAVFRRFRYRPLESPGDSGRSGGCEETGGRA